MTEEKYLIAYKAGHGEAHLKNLRILKNKGVAAFLAGKTGINLWRKKAL